MLIILQSILWSVFGVIIYREQIVGANIPRLLGRTLYWLGVPLQIFFLARKSNFEQIIWLPPLVTVLVLLMGLALALTISRTFKQLFFGDRFKLSLQSQSESSLVVRQTFSITSSAVEKSLLPTTDISVGSFVIASIFGSTGFIDLILIPPLVDFQYWSWISLYGVAHNIIGNYGLGVLIAARYSYSEKRNNWLNQLQSLLFSPSIWAFIYGYASRNLSFPYAIETAISKVVLLVIPGAFILIGMELSTLQQWQNLRSGIFPTIFKMIILPGLAGLLFTLMGMEGDSRLVLVLMFSMPTAFASLILAEEYNLDRQLAANSILLSTLFLPIAILFWVAVF